MSRSVIVKWFYGSLVALAAGLVLLFGAGAVAISADVLVMDGPDVVGIRSTGSAWTLGILLGLAVLVLVGSAVATLVAWIAAVVNTASLPDKTWFVVLLVVGLVGMVFIALVAYVVAALKQIRYPSLRVEISID